MKDYVKISFVGDLMCLNEQNVAVLSKYGTYNYDDVFEHVKDLFIDSDYVVGNLETPLCSQDLSDKMISFNTPSWYAQSIKGVLGLNLVSTANNHCLDRGVAGLKETLDNLDAIGLKHTGTYRTEEESKQITKTNIGGMVVSFVSCTYGTNTKVNGQLLSAEELWCVDLLKKQEKKARLQWKPEYGPIISKYISDNVSPLAIGNAMHQPYLDAILQKIKRAKSESDIVICLPHIGGQYNPAPGSYTRSIMNILAESEADVIVGGHPHVPHKYECINGKFCAFSLGNFSFTPGVGYYLPNTLAEYGLVFHLYFNKSSKTLNKIEFSVVYNHVGEDGISRVWPVADYYSMLTNPVEKDMLAMEVEAVVNRVMGVNMPIEIKDVYNIQC